MIVFILSLIWMVSGLNSAPEKSFATKETPTISKESKAQKELQEAEAKKQAEIDKLTKETQQELSPLKQLVESMKDTLVDFAAMFGSALNSLKSFFGVTEINKLSSPTTTATTEKTPSVKRETLTQANEVAKLLQQPLMKNVKEDKVAFAQGLCELAQKHGGRPEWYLAVGYSESKLNPAATNVKSGATGLWQWMPDTARGLGTTTYALRKMSLTQQLVYVDKYIVQNGVSGKMNSLADVYLAVFFPAALRHKNDPNYIFSTDRLSAKKVASQNPLFNTNKDGKITMREFKNVVDTTVGGRLRNVSLQDYSNVG